MKFHRRFLKVARRLAQRKSLAGWMPEGVVDAGRSLVRWSHTRYHTRAMKRAISGRSGNLADIENYARWNYIRLEAPVILISQVQRSGGTLLSQLLDGHPAIAAYPHELRFGYVTDDEWPVFSAAASCDQNFAALFDLKLPRLMRRGFTKGNQGVEQHRFLMVPRLLYAIYKGAYQDAAPKSLRDDLCLYFTSFFNAWLDYQGLIEQKRWISAFAPRLANDDRRVELFFDAYPDGRLIQIIRDPQSWFASAKRHAKSLKSGETVDDLVSLWILSAESIRRNKERFGERVIVVSFEDIIGNTEETMRKLAAVLSIDYNSVLLTPTFNGRAMRANSSFEVQNKGMIEAPLQRQSTLTDAERGQIAAQCETLHATVLAHAIGRRVLSGVA